MDPQKIIVYDRDKRLLREHYPWVFGKAVRNVPAGTTDGSLVSVFGDDKRFIAYGFFNSRSQIRVKLFEWKEERFDLRTKIEEKIFEAYLFRHHVLRITEKTDAYRLVNSE